MEEQFSANKVKVQFLYPFRVNRWDAFRHGLSSFLDETGNDLYGALVDAHQRMVGAFDAEVGPSTQAREGIRRCLAGTRAKPNKRISNSSLAAEMRSLIRKMQVSFDEPCEVAEDVLCLELAEILRDHEAQAPENVMRFVADRINASSMPLLKDAACRFGDDRGTRAYLERKQPYVEAKLKAEPLAIKNPLVLNDLVTKLPLHSSFRGKPSIRLAPTVRVMLTGFGCLRLKAHLANEQGLMETVDEIVFTGDGDRRRQTPATMKKKTALAAALRPVIVAAVKKRSMSRIIRVLRDYAGQIDTDGIRDRLQTVVDQVTLVNGPLTADDIVDLENLDRGFMRGKEPRLLWQDSDNPEGETLYKYFRHTVQDVFLANLRRALFADEQIREFVRRPERRCDPERTESVLRAQLVSAIPNLSFHAYSLALEEHPYISTFLSGPSALRPGAGLQPGELSEHFRMTIKRYRRDLARILTKSKWAEIKAEWHPARNPLENIFYSDLVHIAVHIRSTLCVYYAPASAEEYMLVPELAIACKYREELNDTLQRQRILWYAYTTSDHLVTQDIRSISAALEVLKEQSIREEFPEVIEGLADVIRGIDRRKMALAEIMEDPLSRKGGSSLFCDLIQKTSEVFHLNTLYQTLHDKVERLDMLGIHVNENVQEYSNLRVQEGTRSAQLTLEFLEAFIIGFYATELTKMGVESMPETAVPVIFEAPWTYWLIAAGAFLTSLPLITLIRKGRSRLAFQNPLWLERMERFGIFVGPAILLAMIYLAFHVKEIRPLEVRFSVPTVLAYAFSYVLAVVGWYQASDKVVERFISRMTERVRHARFGPAVAASVAEIAGESSEQ